MSCHLPVRRRRRLRPLPDLGCQHRLGLTRRLSVPIFHRLAVCPTIIRMVLPVQTCHHILSIWLITISCLLTSALLACGVPSRMACVLQGSVTGKCALRTIGSPPPLPPPPPIPQVYIPHLGRPHKSLSVTLRTDSSSTRRKRCHLSQPADITDDRHRAPASALFGTMARIMPAQVPIQARMQVHALVILPCQAQT